MSLDILSNARAYTAARKSGQCDAFVDDGTPVTINRGVGRTILRQRDWEIQRRTVKTGSHRGHQYDVYISPDGEVVWEFDEAIRLALTAEAAAQDPSLLDVYGVEL